MWRMLWPVLLVVGSNTIYHICAKSASAEINPFASLTLTYLVGAICSAVIFFCTGTQKNLLSEFSKANWTSYALGISIVGLEYGFLCLYRAGWKVSVGNLVASLTLTCVLLAVGLLLYRETLSLRQILGFIVCLAGMVLVAK